MKKNGGIIVGMSTEKIKNIIDGFLLKAYADEEGGADEGGNEGGETTPKVTINYEDLISKARKEEKEKQYKTIERLKGQIETLTTQHNEDLLKSAELEKKLQEATDKLTKAGSGDTEELKVLREEIKTLKAEKEDLEKKVKSTEGQTPVSREEVEAEVRAELEKEYEVKTYKAEKMAELKETILVPELVMGTTKEEIDASIQSALDRSEKIREGLGVTADSKKKEKRTPKSSTPSASGVNDNEISIEYLASLDVGSKEYLEVRKKLGLR